MPLRAVLQAEEYKEHAAILHIEVAMQVQLEWRRSEIGDKEIGGGGKGGEGELQEEMRGSPSAAEHGRGTFCSTIALSAPDEAFDRLFPMHSNARVLRVSAQSPHNLRPGLQLRRAGLAVRAAGQRTPADQDALPGSAGGT